MGLRAGSAVLILFTILYAVVGSASEQNPSHVLAQKVASVENRSVSKTPDPECITEWDCGYIGESDPFCWKEFIVVDRYDYFCENPATEDAYCVNKTKRRYIDWCLPDEECVSGKMICQPKIPPSTEKAEKKQPGECEIRCSIDRNCGIDSWGQTYCGKDGSVYQDYNIHECRNEGECSSFCTVRKITRRLDYCGPSNRCRGGRCYDDPDSEPYTYLNGGYYGERKLEDFKLRVCREGMPCSKEAKTYTTCKGAWCYQVATHYSEVDWEPGRLPENR